MEEAEFVYWSYMGPESVCFYPPGSVEEHLVTEHGIPSVNMRWKVEGYYDHRGDHLLQRGVPIGMVSDLLAVAHPYETQAQDEAA